LYQIGHITISTIAYICLITFNRLQRVVGLCQIIEHEVIGMIQGASQTVLIESCLCLL